MAQTTLKYEKRRGEAEQEFYRWPAFHCDDFLKPPVREKVFKFGLHSKCQSFYQLCIFTFNLFCSALALLNVSFSFLARFRPFQVMKRRVGKTRICLVDSSMKKKANTFYTIISVHRMISLFPFFSFVSSILWRHTLLLEKLFV